MNKDKMEELFDSHSDDFLDFNSIENKLSNRQDLHAFLLLDRLVPGTGDMVSAAEHDEIWLITDEDALSEVVTQEQILELVRCGVMYAKYQGLHMFV